jgi:hypothetical protein
MQLDHALKNGHGVAPLYPITVDLDVTGAARRITITCDERDDPRAVVERALDWAGLLPFSARVNAMADALRERIAAVVSNRRALLESAAARDLATLATYPAAITRSPVVTQDGVDIVERRSTAREIRAAIAREALPVPGQWITIEEFAVGVSAGLTVDVRLGP